MMSSMRAARRCAAPAIRSTCRRVVAASEIQVELALRVASIRASGVRSSCDTADTKLVLASSSEREARRSRKDRHRRPSGVGFRETLAAPDLVRRGEDGVLGADDRRPDSCTSRNGSGGRTVVRRPATRRWPAAAAELLRAVHARTRHGGHADSRRAAALRRTIRRFTSTASMAWGPPRDRGQGRLLAGQDARSVRAEGDASSRRKRPGSGRGPAPAGAQAGRPARVGGRARVAGGLAAGDHRAPSGGRCRSRIGGCPGAGALEVRRTPWWARLGRRGAPQGRRE